MSVLIPFLTSLFCVLDSLYDPLIGRYLNLVARSSPNERKGNEKNVILNTESVYFFVVCFISPFKILASLLRNVSRQQYFSFYGSSSG